MDKQSPRYATNSIGDVWLAATCSVPADTPQKLAERSSAVPRSSEVARQLWQSRGPGPLRRGRAQAPSAMGLRGCAGRHSWGGHAPSESHQAVLFKLLNTLSNARDILVHLWGNPMLHAGGNLKHKTKASNNLAPGALLSTRWQGH